MEGGGPTRLRRHSIRGFLTARRLYRCALRRSDCPFVGPTMRVYCASSVQMRVRLPLRRPDCPFVGPTVRSLRRLRLRRLRLRRLRLRRLRLRRLRLRRLRLRRLRLRRLRLRRLRRYKRVGCGRGAERIVVCVSRQLFGAGKIFLQAASVVRRRRWPILTLTTSCRYPGVVAASVVRRRRWPILTTVRRRRWPLRGRLSPRGGGHRRGEQCEKCPNSS